MELGPNVTALKMQRNVKAPKCNGAQMSLLGALATVRARARAPFVSSLMATAGTECEAENKVKQALTNEARARAGRNQKRKRNRYKH